MLISIAFAAVACCATAGAESCEALLSDGKMNPACVWTWDGKPVEVGSRSRRAEEGKVEV